MTIYGIEGQFGSGKTNLSVKIAYEMAKENAKNIAKSLMNQPGQNYIITNIRMDGDSISNYFYFEDDKFLETLRTLNAINDIERTMYTKKGKGGILKYDRKKFSKFFLFFDESGAIMNNHTKLNNNAVYAEYINQNRKNFEDIYVISAKGGQNNKTIRQMVDWWYYVTPFLDFWFFKHIGIIRKQQKDEEGKVAMKSYIGKDQNGDYIHKQKPIDFYVEWFWRPKYWKFYEDLHKNIRDPDKYTEVNKALFLDIIQFNSDFLKIVGTQKKFQDLNKLLPQPKKTDD